MGKRKLANKTSKKGGGIMLCGTFLEKARAWVNSSGVNWTENGHWQMTATNSRWHLGKAAIVYTGQKFQCSSKIHPRASNLMLSQSAQCFVFGLRTAKKLVPAGDFVLTFSARLPIIQCFVCTCARPVLDGSFVQSSISRCDQCPLKQ